MSIEQDQSKYEVIDYRQPKPGERYFFQAGVNIAFGVRGYSDLYIVKLRPPPGISNNSLSSTTSFSVVKAEKPVLVSEYVDAEGNTAVNTIYDAELAARICGS